MSPLPHRPVRRRSRLTIALAISLGLHLLLLPWIAKDAVFHVPAQVRRTAVGLVATPRNQVQHAQRGPPNSAPSAGKSTPDLSPQLPPALEQEKAKQQKMEGQVVALGERKDDAARPKKEAAAPSSVQTGQNGGARPLPERSAAKAEAPKQDRVQGLHL